MNVIFGESVQCKVCENLYDNKHILVFLLPFNNRPYHEIELKILHELL